MQGVQSAYRSQKQRANSALTLMLPFVSDVIQCYRWCGYRLRESTAINQSVSAIRRVFETLKYNQTHPDAPQVVPYRTNKLTMLLKPMFTGKAGRLGTFTVLLNAYPGKKDYDEKRACLKVR